MGELCPTTIDGMPRGLRKEDDDALAHVETAVATSAASLGAGDDLLNWLQFRCGAGSELVVAWSKLERWSRYAAHERKPQ
jgi:hypothetical protein